MSESFPKVAQFKTVDAFRNRLRQLDLELPVDDEVLSAADGSPLAPTTSTTPSRPWDWFQGCLASQAPFIIQVSKGARKYTDERMLEAIIRSAEQIFPDAIFAVHLVHGDEETCYDCIDSGFYSSVMIDASHETFEQNIAITRRVVEAAHAKGLSVESELGQLGGVEEDIKVDDPGRQRGPSPSWPAGLFSLDAGKGLCDMMVPIRKGGHGWRMLITTNCWNRTLKKIRTRSSSSSTRSGSATAT